MEMKINIKRCFYELWEKKNIIMLTVILSVLVGVYMMLNVEEVGNYTAIASIYSVVYGSYDETVTETDQSGRIFSNRRKFQCGKAGSGHVRQ